MCVCLCACIPHLYGCPQRTEEGIASPEIGVKDSCELPRKQIQVFLKISKCSDPLSHFSSPYVFFWGEGGSVEDTVLLVAQGILKICIQPPECWDCKYEPLDLD